MERVNNNVRKINTLKYFKRNSLIIATAMLTIIILLCMFNFSDANAQNNNRTEYKYYKSIEICEGDSLWSIAKNYFSSEYCSIQDYIKEIKSMNGLTNEIIYAGQFIVISYYSSELK